MPMTTTAAADGVAAAAPLTIALALGVACALAMMALASCGVMVVTEVLEPMLALTMEVAVLASVVATLATELMSGRLATTDELESELEAVELASELETVELESLEAVELDNLAGEEAVDDVDSKEEGLRQQPKTRVNLEQPVDKDAAHLPLELVLAVHVVRVGKSGDLKLLHVGEDFVHVLGDHERVIEILFVEVLCLLGQFLQGLVVQLIVVKCEVLGSEGSLGLGLQDGGTVLWRRHVLGNFLVELDNRSRLDSSCCALLDNRTADTRAASRSLQFR